MGNRFFFRRGGGGKLWEGICGYPKNNNGGGSGRDQVDKPYKLTHDFGEAFFTDLILLLLNLSLSVRYFGREKLNKFAQTKDFGGFSFYC